MKSLIVVLSLLLCSNSYAFQYEEGKCYLSFPLKCVINQKIDNHHLGLVCSDNPISSTHVILEVKKIGFYGVGPINIKYSHKGKKTIQLNNGFDAIADLWKDCEGKDYEEASEDKKRPEECDDICFKQDKKGKDLERCIKESCKPQKKAKK